MSPELRGIIEGVLVIAITGILGTVLELLGNRYKLPGLVALGKKLEAGPNDLPKLIGKRAPDPEILKREIAKEQPFNG